MQDRNDDSLMGVGFEPANQSQQHAQRPGLPPLRLFLVRRITVDDPNGIEEITIEAHTAQVDTGGTLMFIDYVYDEYTRGVRPRMRRAFFAGLIDMEEVILEPLNRISLN